jgi:hypothetical protein
VREHTPYPGRGKGRREQPRTFQVSYCRPVCDPCRAKRGALCSFPGHPALVLLALSSVIHEYGQQPSLVSCSDSGWSYLMGFLRSGAVDHGGGTAQTHPSRQEGMRGRNRRAQHPYGRTRRSAGAARDLLDHCVLDGRSMSSERLLRAMPRAACRVAPTFPIAGFLTLLGWSRDHPEAESPRRLVPASELSGTYEVRTLILGGGHWCAARQVNQI